MEFGIALQWGDMRHLGLSPTLIEIAKCARDLGFRSLWTTDQMTARHDAAYSTEPLVTIASLMHIVPEMMLGVAVLVLPPRNAVVVAKQAATLSLLSNERFVLGIGAGGNQKECELLGADFTTRGLRMDESIEVMRRLWQKDNASFDGQFYKFEDVTMTPKPHAGHVPLWIGGRSPAAIRRAARMGDAWMPALASPQMLGEGVAQIRELSTGRSMPTVASMEFVHPLRGDDVENLRVHIAGTPDEMIAALRAYEQAGLQQLICSFVANDLNELLRQMRVMSEEVMPHFAENS